MKFQQYESPAAAFEHLRSIGQLDYFGRDGYRNEYYVCNLTMPDGRKYAINIYNDGTVKIRS